MCDLHILETRQDNFNKGTLFLRIVFALYLCKLNRAKTYQLKSKYIYLDIYLHYHASYMQRY